MHRPLACDEARPAQGLCGGRLRHASGSPSAITFHDAAMPAWLLDPPWHPAWVEHWASTSLPAWKRYTLDKGLPAQIHHPLLRRSPHHVRALIDSDPANRYVLAGGKPCNMYKAVFSVDRPHVMHRPLARDEGQRLRAVRMRPWPVHRRCWGRGSEQCNPAGFFAFDMLYFNDLLIMDRHIFHDQG